MSAAAETFATGMPVEIGKIERELKKLWEQGDGMMTRASLINLAVYSEAPDSLARNTQIVARIAEEHACRAIVIAIDPEAKQDHVEAWIAAHCHVTCRNQAGLLGADLLRTLPFPDEAAAEHRFLAPGFRLAVLPVVARRASRAGRSAAFQLGRSTYLRQRGVALV